MSFQRCSPPSTYSFIKPLLSSSFSPPFFSSSLSHNRRMGFSSFTFLSFLLLLPFSSPSPSPSNLPILSFHEAYNHLFGDANLLLLNHGKSVHLHLDERTGPLFQSFFLPLHIYLNPFVFLFFLFFFSFYFGFCFQGLDFSLRISIFMDSLVLPLNCLLIILLVLWLLFM